MSEPNETRVTYKAIADFAALRREAARAKAALAALQAQEKSLNDASAKNANAASKSAADRTKAVLAEIAALKKANTARQSYNKNAATIATTVKASTAAIQAQNRALATNTKRLAEAAVAAKAYASAQRSIGRGVTSATSVSKSLKDEVKGLNDSTAAHSKKIRALKEEAQATKEATTATVKFVKEVGTVDSKTGEVIDSSTELGKTKLRLRDQILRARDALREWARENNNTIQAQDRLRRSSDSLYASFRRFGNWRPRLTPPFVALIPIIGAVVAAVNPLIALLGSMGPLVVGLAGQIGSLSGAFLALPGILSGVVAGIAGVIASMGGVGNVFKTYSAMQKAMGAAGSGESAAERSDRLARAEWNLQKAQRSVTKAQENLNKARQQALRDLVDLRTEVSRASMNEDRAIANLRQAQEAYWDVMADPGSTLGDKLDAAVQIKEAEADLQDVRQRNIDNTEALNKLEKEGVENSERVLDAREQLTDAIHAQEDAQKNLSQEVSGSASAAATATAEYEAALAKLSPSARTVVLSLIALGDQWKAMKTEMQENFFSQFVGSMDRFPTLIQNLSKFLTPAAVSMGKLADSFIRMFASPEWTRDLETLGVQNGSVITNLGDGLKWVVTMLKDVAIAAGPFTEWMTNGFAEGAKNFSDFVGNARDTGQLAGWLEKVQGRLSKWWDILKNIGATLFNYSAASEEFGEWISDGLLRITENWRSASQEARRTGSPWKKYLEDVKPLLQSVKGFFGDFFGWLRREMMDPTNIQQATALVEVIRDELGPALSDFLKTLARTNIDQKFVHAVSSIVESLNQIMEAGGVAAFEAFFNVVVSAFDALADLVGLFPPGSVAPLLSLIGGIAGLAFVGKFTGLTNLFGKLVAVGGVSSKINSVIGGIRGLAGKAVGVAAAIGVFTEGVSGILDYERGVRNAANTTEELEGYITGSKGALEALGKVKIPTNLLWGGTDELKDRIGGDLSDVTRLIDKELNYDKRWDEGWGITGWFRRIFDESDKLSDMSQGFRDLGRAQASLIESGKGSEVVRFYKDLNSEMDLTPERAWHIVNQSPELVETLTAIAEESGYAFNEANVLNILLGRFSGIDNSAYTSMENLRSKTAETKEQISLLSDELSGMGNTRMDRVAAVDAAAAAIERLAEAAKAEGITLDGTNQASRDFRAAVADVEKAHGQAAESIRADGGNLDEVKGKWSEGRTAIEEYVKQLAGGDGGAARTWADQQLGPAGEVLLKIEALFNAFDTLNKLEMVEKTIGFRYQINGSDFDPFGGNPTTEVNGRTVVDFWAMGEDVRAKNQAGGGGGAPRGGMGGGMSVSGAAPINFGLADKVKEETDAASKTWGSFWSDFGKKPKSPMDTMKGDISTTLSWIDSNPFKNFQSAGRLMQVTFGLITTGIGMAWSNLMNVFSAPANFVIDKVYNNGIAAWWNALAEKVGLGSLTLPKANLVETRRAEGGVLPGYTPGRDVHEFTSPTAGRLLLSGGEAIMRPEFTRAVGGKKGVDELNRRARKGQAFATGGVWDNLGRGSQASRKNNGKPQSRKNSRSWVDEVGSIANDVMQFFMDPVGSIVNGATNLISGLLPQIGGGQFGDMLRKMPGMAIQGLAKQAESSALPYGGEYKGDANAIGWRRMYQIISTQFPGTRLNSGFRPGDSTMHGKGRAIDIPPNMAHFNWLRKNFPNSQALIYTPAGRSQLYQGKPHVWGEPYASTHYDHIHWAMKQGGVLGKMPKLYDQGGWIPHGGMAMNLSGKPEAVLTNSESRALKSLLAGGGIAARQAFGASPATAISGAPGMVDNSITIEHLVVQNPVREKVSESLPKAIRRIGYMQNARERA